MSEREGEGGSKIATESVRVSVWVWEREGKGGRECVCE